MSRKSAFSSLIQAVEDLTPSELIRYLREATLPATLERALRNVVRFARHRSDTYLDLQRRNFIQRSDGTLILNDPVYAG